jgi:hypothetical protein
LEVNKPEKREMWRRDQQQQASSEKNRKIVVKSRFVIIISRTAFRMFRRFLPPPLVRPFSGFSSLSSELNSQIEINFWWAFSRMLLGRKGILDRKLN